MIAVTEPGHQGRLRYMPALDGLRGVAVMAVLLFHSELAWARGGHLGVTAFFTLSGFLITSLLLVEREHSGTIGMAAFWARRARRLVPAALVCFGLVAVAVALSSSPPPSGLMGDAVAAATWSANWHFILADQTYADVFALPSPFQHFWSLAVEEQFYLAFPLLLMAVVGSRRQPLRRGRLALVLGALVVASTVQAARLHVPGDAIGRAYYGTDARIAEILVGALLALAIVGPAGIKTLTGQWRRLAGGMGAAGAVGLTIAFGLLGERDTLLYEGGFLVVALCTAATIAAAVQPGSVLGRLLANRPLVALGKVSYGTYLFHWPVFLLVTADSTGLQAGPLLAVRAGVTIGLAALSYVLVEAPIRYGRLPRGVGLVGWANGAVAGLALVAFGSGQLVPVAPGSAAAGEGTVTAAAGAGVATGGVAPAPGAAGGTQAGTTGGGATNRAPGVASQGPAAAPAAPAPAPAAAPPGFSDDPGKAKVPPVPEAPPARLKVAVVGDSIGLNLGQGLQTWAGERGDVVVYNLAFAGCPVSRGGERRFGNGEPLAIHPVCGWWDDPSTHRAKALDQFAPDVVVVQAGINEMLDRRVPEWDDWRRPGDARFDHWLRDEYQAALSTWSAAGAEIVVTNAPCADWDRYEAFRSVQDAELRIQALNVNVYRALFGVTVADLFQRLCPTGTYSNEVEGVENGRPGGFHLSPEASAALARNWLGPIVLEATSEQLPTPLPDA